MKKKILVVDDEDDILHFLELVLREKGYDVVTASERHLPGPRRRLEAGAEAGRAGRDVEVVDEQLGVRVGPEPEVPLPVRAVDDIDEGELSRISEELMRGIGDDLQSRKDWIEDRAQGIKLLGLKIEIPGLQGASDGAPVEGMSKVRHPLLLEAVSCAFRPMRAASCCRPTARSRSGTTPTARRSSATSWPMPSKRT